MEEMITTYDEKRDGERLRTQDARIFRLMADSCERTLGEIELMTGYPQASISARLRGFRADGHVVERRHVRNGLWVYRLVPAQVAA